MQFAIAVVILAVVKGVFSAGDRSRRQATDYSPLQTQPGQGYQAPQPTGLKPQPKNRQRLSVGQIVELHREALKRRPDLQMSVQEFSRFMQANQSEYDFSEGIAYSPPASTPRPGPASPFTTAATPAQQLGAKGDSEAVLPRVPPAPVLEQPTAAGTSKPPAHEAAASPNTRVDDTNKVEVVLTKTRDLIVATPSGPNPGFFSVGSTKDEVLAVQGTPDRFTDSTFTYGASQVRFKEKDGKVESWSDTGYPKLKAKLLPTGQVEAKDYFTVGSTRDEVLGILGTPDRFSDRSFTYGPATIRFRGDRVVSWNGGCPKLERE